MNSVPAFDLSDHVLQHLFIYVRLLLLMASWFFVSYESFIFIATVMFTIVFGFADRLIMSFSVKSEVRDMLFQILEKITSSMLIFAVVSKLKLF